MRGETREVRLGRFGRLRTIGLDVDFLSPGLGKWFVATVHALRKENKVAVTRIELNNDQNDLIAVGTASYVVA